jgi:hypothetical protein
MRASASLCSFILRLELRQRLRQRKIAEASNSLAETGGFWQQIGRW